MRSLALAAIVAFGAAFGATLPPQKVASAAITWVRNITADKMPKASVDHIEPYVEGGDTLFYVIQLSPSGFCVCGAKDFALPVYLYSPTIDADELFETRRHLLDELVVQMKELEQTYLQDSAEISEELAIRRIYWDSLALGFVPLSLSLDGIYTGPDSMSLGNVPISWDNRQWYPFNDKCPVLPASDHCGERETPDGCVAHSMSALMRYWEWPPYGSGTDSTTFVRRYSAVWQTWPLSFNPFKPDFDSTACPWRGRLMWSSAGGGMLMMKDWWDKGLLGSAKKQADPSLSDAQDSTFKAALDSLFWHRLTNRDTVLAVDFSAATYNWDAMPLIRDSIDSPTERDAVSTIAFHAGVAAHMGYTTTGSGATANGAEYALENHFFYDSDMDTVILPRCTYAPDTCPCASDWDTVSADDTCACHEPDTCEGAKAVMEEIQWLRPVIYFHGKPLYHAWVVSGYNRLMLPDEMQFIGTFSTPVWKTMDHIVHHPFLRRIAPVYWVRFVGSTTSGDGSPGDPYRNIEEAVADAPSGATLIFKAGTTNYFSADTLLVTKHLILKGRDVRVMRDH